MFRLPPQVFIFEREESPLTDDYAFVEGSHALEVALTQVKPRTWTVSEPLIYIALTGTRIISKKIMSLWKNNSFDEDCSFSSQLIEQNLHLLSKSVLDYQTLREKGECEAEEAYSKALPDVEFDLPTKYSDKVSCLMKDLKRLIYFFLEIKVESYTFLDSVNYHNPLFSDVSVHEVRRPFL